MPSYVVSIAAAVAIVGADLFAGERWKEQPNDRVMTGLALRGSAAAGDTVVDLMVDETRVAQLVNNATGFPDNDDMVDLAVIIPANAELSAIVTDAAVTNPINLRVDLEG